MNDKRFFVTATATNQYLRKATLTEKLAKTGPRKPVFIRQFDDFFKSPVMADKKVMAGKKKTGC